MSLAEEVFAEKLSFWIALASMDKSKHLKDREDQYVRTGLSTPPNIYLIRETEEGWWQECEDLKKDVERQMQKHLEDPTVAHAWIITRRFSGSGGWGID